MLIWVIHIYSSHAKLKIVTAQKVQWIQMLHVVLRMQVFLINVRSMNSAGLVQLHT